MVLPEGSSSVAGGIHPPEVISGMNSPTYGKRFYYVQRINFMASEDLLDLHWRWRIHSVVGATITVAGGFIRPK
jgi:hypothetical protein